VYINYRKVSQRLPKERLFDDGDYGLLDTNQIPTDVTARQAPLVTISSLVINHSYV